MTAKHFIIIAATCIGAFVAYQWIQAGRAEEQCKREAVALAAASGSGMSGVTQGLLRCAVLYGKPRNGASTS